MRSSKFSIMTTLLSIINESSSDDANCILAEYFLKNFDHIKDLDIMDVYNDCYVSISSIRRFCNAIGYKNFTDFRNDHFEFSFQKSKISYFLDNIEEDGIKVSIKKVLFEIDSITSDQIRSFAENLRETDNIHFFVSETSGTTVRYFQQCLASLQKLIHVVTSSYYDDSKFENLTTDDTLVIVSLSGYFIARYIDDIKNINCNKVLITLTHEYDTYFDSVIVLSEDVDVDEHVLFTTYGLNYFFDRVLKAYWQLTRK